MMEIPEFEFKQGDLVIPQVSQNNRETKCIVMGQMLYICETETGIAIEKLYRLSTVQGKAIQMMEFELQRAMAHT